MLVQGHFCSKNQPVISSTLLEMKIRLDQLLEHLCTVLKSQTNLHVYQKYFKVITTKVHKGYFTKFVRDKLALIILPWQFCRHFKKPVVITTVEQRICNINCQVRALCFQLARWRHGVKEDRAFCYCAS